MTSTRKQNHMPASSGRLPRRSTLIGLGAVLSVTLAVTAAAGAASAAPGDPSFLGAAEPFSVLAHTTVTNSGAATLLDRQLGVDAGTATGLLLTQTPAGTHFGDATSITAQTDATTAVNALMAAPNYVYGAPDLAGHTFVAGAYSSATNLNNTGVITLQGDADDVFIFTAVDQIVIGGSTSMVFIGGAQACNVFWRSGSDTAIGTNAAFAGTVIAGTSVNVNTDATIDGRLIAQTAQVSLLNNVFVSTLCATGGDGDRGLSVAPIAPTVTAAPVVPIPPATTGGGNTTLANTGAVLAATGVDVTRPALVAALVLLLGVVMLTASGLRQSRRKQV